MEQPSFERFVAARGPALLRTAWLLTGDEFLAQDLLQASLLRVWPRWSAITRDGAAESYVRTTMTRLATSWWRRRWRLEIPHDRLPDPTAGPDHYADADQREVLRRALLLLPPRQRAVVVLRYFEDLTEAQTAAALGCAVGTVKSQASAALRTLREALPAGVPSREADL